MDDRLGVRSAVVRVARAGEPSTCRPLAVAAFVALVGCVASPSAPSTDGGGPDAASTDVGPDAVSDGARDASAPDADIRDAGHDAADLDANVVETTSRLAAGLCQPMTQAACRLGRSCACPTAPDPLADCGVAFPSPPGPFDFALCAYTLDELSAMVTADAAVLDEANVARCLDTQEHALDACIALPRDLFQLRACARMLRSPIPVGAACRAPGVCASGAGVCDGRTCRAAPMRGQPCSTSCRDDLACVGGICTDPVALGGTCSDDEDCAAPERCRGGVCGGSAVAATCAGDAQCAVGSTCASGHCSTPTMLGTTCDPATPMCGHDASCVARGEYRCQPPVGAGAPCMDDSTCGDGLACVGHVCTAGPGADEACSPSGRCGAGLRCSLDGICHPVAGRGASCGPSSPCAAPLACVSSVCTAPPTSGPCALGGSCAATASCGADGNCHALGAAGGGCPCLPDLSCVGATCVAGLFAMLGEVCTDPTTGHTASCVAGAECVPEGGGFWRCHAGSLGDRCLSLCDPGLRCGPDLTTRVCQSDACGAAWQFRCDDDSDCPPAQRCDLATFACRR